MLCQGRLARTEPAVCRDREQAAVAPATESLCPA